jgi:hypothetical protein
MVFTECEQSDHGYWRSLVLAFVDLSWQLLVVEQDIWLCSILEELQASCGLLVQDSFFWLASYAFTINLQCD